MWWKVGSGSTGGLLDNRPIPTAMKLPDSTGKQANSGAARTLKRVCCYTNKHGQMRTYPESICTPKTLVRRGGVVWGNLSTGVYKRHFQDLSDTTLSSKIALKYPPARLIGVL